MPHRDGDGADGKLGVLGGCELPPASALHAAGGAERPEGESVAGRDGREVGRGGTGVRLDEDDGSLSQPVEQRLDLGSRVRIEASVGLDDEEDLWTCDGDGCADKAACLAAGEPGRVAFGEFGETDGVEHRVDACGHLGARGSAVLEGQGEFFADGGAQERDVGGGVGADDGIDAPLRRKLVGDLVGVLVEADRDGRDLAGNGF